MTKPKIYMADEIWAGKEYNPVEVPMGTEFVSKQDYDELEARLTKAENKRITELEAALKYVRETADMQLETIINMDKNLAKAESERDESTDEIILLGNDIVNLRSELSELKRSIDKAPFVWVARFKHSGRLICAHGELERWGYMWKPTNPEVSEQMLPRHLFPTLKWEDEPIQVALVKMGSE